MNQFKKFEFGFVTAVFLLLLFSLLYPSIIYNVFELQSIYGHKFAQYHQVFDYYLHYLLPTMGRVVLIYASFLLVNFIIVPEFFEREKWVKGMLMLLPLGVFYFLMMMVADSYYRGYLFGVYDTIQGAHTHFAKSAFITTVFSGVLYVIYYYVRRVLLDLFYPRYMKDPVFRQMMTEIFWASGLIVVLFCLSFSDSRDTALMIFFFGPTSIVVFFVLRYKVLPEYAASNNRALMLRDAIFTILGSNVLMALICRAIGHRNGGWFVALGATGIFVSAAIVAPLSWLLFKTRQQQQATVVTLKKALGHSAANLDFLRSQINPHFLFNALNTLYGTALQEEAARTSEGIQKLGDMMRFMLHDNHLEKIPLDKEVAYLQNYIALQRLRVLSSPDILIEVNIDESQCQHEIAPMLLIPFVENAFKHGISLRHRSRIVISLSCTAEQIFFDVYNSVHPRPENDPEREGMGIGLNNVKERLALLYPHRHELSIRHTATEFFVHLTIDVNK
ncbi:histidine kinase [Chitinophaga polysaccharea]|uniref:Histidine kinase n=1 Tax=Chitinophaga polysaccharea TaxID=1293035 RepID=A0A561PLH5_9BACT|nr:histidine kinase [Chitinophaga polysaccharea]TWF38940.1 histidine kinase [Chitinophaga polysaccharea]